MKRRFYSKFSSKSAFTLIEVIISLAVVTVAIIATMGLMAVFLQGTKAVVERNEALSICQTLNAYLQTPSISTSSVTQGFDRVYTWIQSGTVPSLYAFTLPVDNTGSYNSSGGIPQMQVTAPTDANYTNISHRIGRLYYISLSLSSNVPIHQGVGRIATYNPTSLPATWYPTGSTDVSFYADSSLAISVRVYAVATTSNLTANKLETQDFNYPILLYDTVVNR